MSTDQPTQSAPERSAATTHIRGEDQTPPAAEETHRIGLPYLSIPAFAVGIVTGLGAVAFRDLIGFLHNLLFLGQFAFRYDANLFTPPSPWGPFVILVPVIGALAVTFLVTKFAPEARGHGVPEVMDAIYYRGGIIRPIVAVVKSLASAIAIGSGAAVGREGPIIQIGSALGSTLGQVVRMLPGSGLRSWRRAPVPVSPRLSIRRSAASCSRSS
jgi:CIC family chloride channel protein